MTLARVALLAVLLVAGSARAQQQWRAAPAPAEAGLFFVVPRLPNVDMADWAWRILGLTAAGTLGAVIVTRGSFYLTCPELARDFDASNPSCKAPALIGTALLAPPTAAGALLAIGWLLGRPETSLGTIIGGSIGTGVGLLTWIIPMSTSARTVSLPVFSALGAAVGFEIAFSTHREATELTVGWSGDRLTVAGRF